MHGETNLVLQLLWGKSLLFSNQGLLLVCVKVFCTYQFNNINHQGLFARTVFICYHCKIQPGFICIFYHGI